MVFMGEMTAKFRKLIELKTSKKGAYKFENEYSFSFLYLNYKFNIFKIAWYYYRIFIL